MPENETGISKSPAIHQQLVHIFGPTPGGRLLLIPSSRPTENVDISFLTPPRQRGHFTSELWLMTSLSNL
jgi:hypothetical protein